MSVVRHQRRGIARDREREMERIGRPQRDGIDRKKKPLRLAMHGRKELDTPIESLGHVAEDRAMQPRHHRSIQTSFATPAGERRNDLGDREIGDQQIAATLDRPIQLCASGLRHVELDQGAGIAVQRAGELGWPPGSRTGRRDLQR